MHVAEHRDFSVGSKSRRHLSQDVTRLIRRCVFLLVEDKKCIMYLLFQFGFCCFDKHRDVKHPGKKGFDAVYRLQSAFEGAQGRCWEEKLKQRTRRIAASWFALRLTIQPRTTCPEMALFPVGGLSCNQLAIKTFFFQIQFHYLMYLLIFNHLKTFSFFLAYQQTWFSNQSKSSKFSELRGTEKKNTRVESLLQFI